MRFSKAFQSLENAIKKGKVNKALRCCQAVGLSPTSCEEIYFFTLEVKAKKADK